MLIQSANLAQPEPYFVAPKQNSPVFGESWAATFDEFEFIAR